MNFANAPQQTWDDWVAYEARLNHVIPKYPDPILCTYDISKFTGALVIDLIRTHPGGDPRRRAPREPILRAAGRVPHSAS